MEKMDPVERAILFLGICELIDPEKDVEDAESALAGARDIIAEIFSENADMRKKIREYTLKKSFLSSKARAEDSDRVYELYFDYSEPIEKIPAHRMLAINRGEKENVLKVSMDIDPDDIYQIMKNNFVKNTNATFKEDILSAIRMLQEKASIVAGTWLFPIP